MSTPRFAPHRRRRFAARFAEDEIRPKLLRRR
ncbi:hypothetical protein HNR73_002710 [Phytomonospora endophytica]|uniref:Uncharacterized protein n=1 Tax=Phytomonospora endophytica TaxID=714109 RepID=A0A841FF11_9ACTN|nr:hypothetical protein [Phytomonospora endophytica]